MGKLKVAVLFGGQSSEHEVSCRSALTIIHNMDKERYEQLLVGITKEGRWLLTESAEAVEDGSWKAGNTEMILSPDTTHKGFIAIKDGKSEVVPVDVVFPVLHGLYGEDGTVQGVLELARIPYVGCGVVASGVSMDKLFTKIIAATVGVKQAKYEAVRKSELDDMDSVVSRIESVLPYPVFIKPANAGSSCGVSKASDREGLVKGLKLAACHDRKILVEETIVGREIECAVLGGADPVASGVGEVLPAGEAVFYDYDAKYANADSKTDTHPAFPEGKEDEIRHDAVEIFKAVDGYGLARVDFFLQPDGTVVFNEINTLPGFTSISMYPMLWDAKGLKVNALIDKLIELALKRF
jgi:D-alanine-D-alanine ligase